MLFRVAVTGFLCLVAGVGLLLVRFVFYLLWFVLLILVCCEWVWVELLFAWDLDILVGGRVALFRCIDFVEVVILYFNCDCLS